MTAWPHRARLPAFSEAEPVASPLDQGHGTTIDAPAVEAQARQGTAHGASAVSVDTPPSDPGTAVNAKPLRRRWLVPAALLSVSAHAAAIYALVSWLDLRSVEAETDEVSIEIVIEQPEMAGAAAEQADSDGMQPDAAVPADFAPPDPFVSQLTQPPEFPPSAGSAIKTPDLPETIAGPPPMPPVATVDLPEPGTLAVLAAPPRFEPVEPEANPEAAPKAKPAAPQARQAAPQNAGKPAPDKKPRNTVREPERKEQKRRADKSEKKETEKASRNQRNAQTDDRKRDAARSSPSTAAGKTGKGAGAKDRKQGETGKTASSAAGGAAQYGALVNRHVQRFRRYPAEAERAGIKGVVRVSIRIDSSGRLSSASLRAGSGHPVLDREALATVKRASPYPKPPAGVAPASFSLTLRFSR